MHEHDEILVALVGQPNSGKSTIFNFLTGLHQTIANYPGVTVEKKSGHYHDGKRRIEVVDLPGTYSLTSYSQEERVTRDFLLLERPEVVVAVVDESNLRRHLYFVFQLLELRVPLVVCLNMTDIAKRRGISIDLEKLGRELNIPIVPTNGRTGEGLDSLREKISEISSLHDHDPKTTWTINYGPLEPLIRDFDTILSQKELLVKDFPSRWLAIKLLENDREARRIVQHHIHEREWEPLLNPCMKKAEEYEKTTGDSPRKIIAARRNERAEEIERRVSERIVVPKRKTDTIDRFLCHPILGLFAVALVMFVTFQLAFNISGEWSWVPWPTFDEDKHATFEMTSPVGALENLFEVWIPLALDKTLGLQDGDLKSLIYDGIVAGVGGVLVFVPVIFTIFLFISALNQSGYMARIVVVLDRIMRFFGLQGQSVLPMLLGGGIVGGCAVPAIMATRTMRETRERLLTILVIPMMNCGAKIPVYALLIAAFFFGAWRGAVMAGIILFSWAVALLSAWFLGKTVVRGNPLPLVIELPTYQVPSLFEVFATACRQSWMFIKKAGTIILAVNVLLWAMMYYPAPADPGTSDTERLANSYAGRLGHCLEPVSRLAGFDWRDNIALVGGFAAKEVIVSSLSTIYGIESGDETVEENPAVGSDTVSDDAPVESADNELEEGDKKLAETLRSEPNWSPVKALAFLVFVMFYAPCFPTCAIIRKETGSWKYMFIAMIYTTVLAIVLAIAIYQIGILLY